MSVGSDQAVLQIYRIFFRYLESITDDVSYGWQYLDHENIIKGNTLPPATSAIVEMYISMQEYARTLSHYALICRNAEQSMNYDIYWGG